MDYWWYFGCDCQRGKTLEQSGEQAAAHWGNRGRRLRDDLLAREAEQSEYPGANQQQQQAAGFRSRDDQRPQRTADN
jgi:hypothetical protein